MSNCFDFHPIQPQIYRRFIDVVSITNASNGNIMAFITPSTLAFAMAFAMDSVAALISIDFKNAFEYAEAILVANVVAIVSSIEAFAVAIAVNISTSCVDDHVSLLGCFDVVRVWRCRSLSNSTSFLRLFVADIFPAGEGEDISRSTRWPSKTGYKSTQITSDLDDVEMSDSERYDFHFYLTSRYRGT